MAFSGSSIAILFIGVAVYAAAGPVQLHGGSNTVQREDYGSPALAELLARYWEDRGTHQDAKRNLDQIGGGHLVRSVDEQLRRLLNEEKDRLSPNSADDAQIVDQFRDANMLNSAINSETIIDAINHPYNYDLNADEANDQASNQLVDDDVLKNACDDKRIARNLDQIGGGHLVRNLDQIGGGHLMRNLDQIGGGHLVRNLDQIGGGHLVRNLDQIGGGHLVRNLDQIGGGHLVRNLDQIGGGHLVRNLDQIGGGHLVRNLPQIGDGHLVRNLDQIGGGNLVRSLDYLSAETKRRTNQPGGIFEKLYFSRNLDQIGGGNLLRNLDQIGGGNLVRGFEISADIAQALWNVQGTGGRNLNGAGGGHLLRQARRGFDPLSGATFGESKRLSSFRRPGASNIRNFDEIDRSVFDRFSKRNIDEIDNTFDSFYKRNFDEIDRVGWSGFVKRLDNYLADRQRR